MVFPVLRYKKDHLSMLVFLALKISEDINITMFKSIKVSFFYISPSIISYFDISPANLDICPLVPPIY